MMVSPLIDSSSSLSPLISYYYSISGICTRKREGKKLNYFVQSRRQLCVLCCAVCVFTGHLCTATAPHNSYRCDASLRLIIHSYADLICCCCCLFRFAAVLCIASAPLLLLLSSYLCLLVQTFSKHTQRADTFRHTVAPLLCEL